MFAQNPSYDSTSATPIMGVGHDYIQSLNEIVNPADGSVSVRIAIPTPQERGLNFPLYAYIYDTNGQYSLQPLFTAGSPSIGYPMLINYIEIVGYGGTASTGGSTLTGAPANQENVSQFSVQPPGTLSHQAITMSSGTSHLCQVFTDYVYVDTSGGRHSLGNLGYIPPQDLTAVGCGYFGGTPPVSSTGGDGIVSGILDPNSPNADAYVFDAHGNHRGGSDSLV